MEASGGSPTQMRAPERDKPLSSVRRESRNRLVITCDTSGSSLEREFPRQNQRGHEFLKLELRALEIRGDPGNHRTVAGRVRTACDVAEILFHNAFLALRGPRQHLAQFAGRGEFGVLNAS